GLSTVLAFIDLKSAFYKVIRPVVMPFLQDPQDIADAVDAADIPEDAETDCLADSSFVDDLGVMAAVQSGTGLPQAMSDVVVTVSKATV
ncbi:unnamed protein product, partial [Prorocentrum cordatum]